MQRKRRWLVLGAATITAVAVLAVPLSGIGGAQTANGCDEVDWPLATVSCAQYQATGARLERADGFTPRIGREQAAEEARQQQPGADVLEVELVRAFSDTANGSDAKGRLVWAVSMTLPDGPALSGGAFLQEELRSIRPDGDLNRPLTAEESAKLQEGVTNRVNAMRSAATQVYRLEFIDPETGEWLGGAEGAAIP
ncbi:MAG: hypothetical protein ACM3S1_12705 [Hyphomicrobiales bacterium]